MEVKELVKRLIPDSAYLKIVYRHRMGKRLNLKNPRTFNEKLQWLKLHDRNPLYTTLVDKYAVKDYVAGIIGYEYIIPTLGVWNHFDEIDFDALPEQFVLKCTHDSGGLVICRDKRTLDKSAAKAKLERCLKRNYYYAGREWPYKNVKPRILAERYMEDDATGELRDYKFFCFGGVARCYKVDFDRLIEHRANYFTAEGELMKLGEEVCPPDFERDIQPPAHLEEMKELAGRLSHTVPFLRADFYEADGKTYFGELTFYPASGFGRFIHEDNDALLGSWIKLPENSIWGGVEYCLLYKDLLVTLSLKQAVRKERGLSDYKIHSFNGEPKFIQVDYDRFTCHKRNLYDLDWNYMEAKFIYPTDPLHQIKRPERLKDMLQMARKLSAGTSYLRTDFYAICDRIYFGEITFFAESGFGTFNPESLDAQMGEWIKLP